MIEAEATSIEAGALQTAYFEFGAPDGWPCILSHGFPYAPQAYKKSAQALGNAGARVIVPYLRGYGPTRFISKATPRSGEQAALGADLLALLDALDIERAVLAGYDWGGRASCIVAALFPERVIALVSGNSYNIFDHAKALNPAPAAVEAGNWYQYFFHSERGRRALEQDRRGIARQLWSMWSPNWAFDDATLEETAAAFNNPDFVDVVIHSYRHRYNLVAGDPAYAGIEARLAVQPNITVPAITIDGSADRPGTDTRHHAAKFTGPHQHRRWNGTGHNLPQEEPGLWADAVIEAHEISKRSTI